MPKKLNKSVEWMALRARHATMGRTVLQLIANPESKASDISAAAEMYREATAILETEYVALTKTMSGSSYLPVLTHRGKTHQKVIIRHKPRTNV